MRFAVATMPRHLRPSFECFCGKEITHSNVNKLGHISFECIDGHHCLPVAIDGKVVIKEVEP